MTKVKIRQGTDVSLDIVQCVRIGLLHWRCCCTFGLRFCFCFGLRPWSCMVLKTGANMGSKVSKKTGSLIGSKQWLERYTLTLKTTYFECSATPAGRPDSFTAWMISLTLVDPIEPVPAAPMLLSKKASTDAPEASARIFILCCTLTSSFSTRLVAVETQNFIKDTSPGRSGSGTPLPLLTTALIFWGGMFLRVISATVRSSRSEVTVVPCDFMRHMSASIAAAFCPDSIHCRKSFLRSLDLGRQNVLKDRWVRLNLLKSALFKIKINICRVH